jgi:DNA replication and repair protein RecF
VAEAFDRLEAMDSLAVTYAATVPFDERPTPEIFAAALERVRGAERGAGVTLVGPHRDDLKITMNGVEMAKHASRGQARLAALGLRVAEARLMEERRGDPPVVLLDDVLSELDGRRRTLVLEEAARNHQTIVTTADLDQVPRNFLEGAHRLRVDGGAVEYETA